MSSPPVVVSLPIADRRRSYAFYRDGLGFDAVGTPAEDGVPEPLQFELNGGVRLMLIPSGGFGWIIGDRQVAPPGHSECVMSLRSTTDADVDDLVRGAQDAGARIVSEPGRQPWGYAGTFTDPDGHLWMAISEALPS
jgi:predicted lactoylglutathione lyase